MKHIKRTTKKNAAYIQMAIEKLIETCDWVSDDDNNILVFSDGYDWVAIPDAYEGVVTGFSSTMDVSYMLRSDKKYNYIAVPFEITAEEYM